MLGLGLCVAMQYLGYTKRVDEINCFGHGAVDAAMAAQIAFKRQVQDWKDILLRGSNHRDYERYQQKFLAQKTKVERNVIDLIKTLQRYPQPLDLAKDFKRQYQQLNLHYSEALARYQPTIPNIRKIDALVKGMDREPSRLLDVLVVKVRKMMKQMEDEQKRQFNRDMLILLPLTGLALFIYFLFLFRFIRQDVVAPLIHAKKITENIAQGDYQQEIKEGRSIEFNRLFKALQLLQSRLASSRLALDNKMSELLEANKQIHKNRNFDLLTELPNRLLLMDRLDIFLRNFNSKKSGILFIVDIDHFKLVNDALGYEVGDSLLKNIARNILQNCDQSEDTTIARIGGDEFAIFMPLYDHDEQQLIKVAVFVADKVLAIFADAIDINKKNLYVTVSIGGVYITDEHRSAERLLQQADTAVNQAKKSGRNQVCFFSHDMQKKVDEHLNLLNQMKFALTNQQFSLHYQPQVSVAGRLIGAEALLRWNSPKLGVVSPADFIPAAEASGFIVQIGDWVLMECCRFIKDLMDHDLIQGMAHISVNISPKQFHQVDFIEKLQKVVHQSGIDPRKLGVEITEGIVIENMDQTISRMKAIKLMGVHLSIDDFGTGYSSLSYLKRLPLDTLKIDQSFVRDLPEDADDAAIVETILSLSKHLGFSTIAEGVETIEQAEYLAQRGCHQFQGYHFSKPLPEKDFVHFIRHGGVLKIAGQK